MVLDCVLVEIHKSNIRRFVSHSFCVFGETFDTAGNNNKHKEKDSKFEPTV